MRQLYTNGQPSKDYDLKNKHWNVRNNVFNWPSYVAGLLLINEK